MKIKYLVIVSIMLAIITIGAASATDSSDTLATDYTGGDEISTVDNDFIAEDDNFGDGGDDTGGDDPDEQEDTRNNVAFYMDPYVPESRGLDNYDDQISIKIDSRDITGNITITVDGEEKYNQEIEPYYWGYDENMNYEEYGGNYLYIKDLGLTKQKEYDVVISYAGDDNYKPFTKNYTTYLYVMDVDVGSYYDDEVTKDSGFYISVIKSATGKVEVLIDNKSYLNLTAEEINDISYYEIEIKDIPYGYHEYTVKYSDDEQYEADPISGTFTYTYEFKGYLENDYDEYINYGPELQFNIYTPDDAKGMIVVSYEGKTLNVTPNKGEATVYIKDYGLGYVEFTFTYVGSDYPVKSFTRYLPIEPFLRVPYEFRYGSDDEIILKMPANATGYLVIYKRGEYNDTIENFEWEILSNISVKEGKASYPVSNFPLGYYAFKVAYEGIDYENYFDNGRVYDRESVPTVEVADVLYYGEDYNMTLIFPDDYNKTVNITFKEQYWDEGYCHQNETLLFTGIPKGTVIIPLPKDKNGDYIISTNGSAIYEGYLYYSEWVYADETYIHGDYDYISVSLHNNEKGYVNLYIDGKLFDTQILEYGRVYFDLIKATIGKHDFELVYYNENNQKVMSKSGSFIMDYSISILYEDKLDNCPLTDNLELIISVPLDAKGTVTVDVNGTTYTATPVEGVAKVTITNLKMGENNITITYGGDDKYPVKTINKTLIFEDYEIFVKYDTDDKFVSVSLLLPSEADGNLTLVNENGYIVKTVKLENGSAIFKLSDFGIGTYDLTAKYVSETEDYEVSDSEFQFKVYPEINIPYEITYGSNATVTIKMPNATGELNIYVGGEKVANITAKDGVFETIIPGLKFGENTVTFEYVGDDYDNVFADEDYTVVVGPLKVEIPEKSTNATFSIIFEVPEGFSGDLSVYAEFEEDFDAIFYELIFEDANYTSAKKTITIKDYTYSTNIKLVFTDKVHGEYIKYQFVEGSKPDASSNVNIPSEITSDSLDVVLPKDAKGGIIVTIDGETQYILLKNGSAKVDLSKLSEGQHNISIKYSGDDKYGEFEKTATVNVPSKTPAVDPKITAKDLSVIYSAGTKYTVTVYGTDGKVAANVEVVFLINGKKFQTVKTNAKGIATVKITQKPGTYKITAKALGKEVTKKLTVKHVLKLKKVKVKRSAKKLVIKATLAKVNGKYLKGKKITLKFNGKKFKAKTNKKGVAKFTIKKKFLKKLKKGKKVTYQATYLKDTVKYSVKVKK